jgi:hypothetical protein
VALLLALQAMQIEPNSYEVRANGKAAISLPVAKRYFVFCELLAGFLSIAQAPRASCSRKSIGTRTLAALCRPGKETGIHPVDDTAGELRQHFHQLPPDHCRRYERRRHHPAPRPCRSAWCTSKVLFAASPEPTCTSTTFPATRNGQVLDWLRAVRVTMTWRCSS